MRKRYVSAMRFTPDDHLDYTRLATQFTAGHAMRLDEPYRRAHLPLVAPDHPDVIARDDMAGYHNGRHTRVWSLVIPMDWQALTTSKGFRIIEDAMKNGPLAGKIGWRVMEQRRHILHATIAGNLVRGETPPDVTAWREALKRIPRFQGELRGLFSGNINLGRFYFKLYPEWRDGGNAIHAVQRALGRSETSLYVVGHYLLIDHLTPAETGWLAARLAEWQGLPILRLRVRHLDLLGASDDQALDSIVAEQLKLG